MSKPGPRGEFALRLEIKKQEQCLRGMQDMLHGLAVAHERSKAMLLCAGKLLIQEEWANGLNGCAFCKRLREEGHSESCEAVQTVLAICWILGFFV